VRIAALRPERELTTLGGGGHGHGSRLRPERELTTLGGGGAVTAHGCRQSRPRYIQSRVSYWVYLERLEQPLTREVLRRFAADRADVRLEGDVLVFAGGGGARIGLDRDGTCSTKNPDAPTLDLLAELARIVGGFVSGEDGQEFFRPHEPPAGPRPAGWSALAAAPHWAPIVGFVGRWYEPLSSVDALDPGLLAKAKVAVPKVVSEFYSLMGRRADVCGRFDPQAEGGDGVELLAPREWRESDGVLTVALESNWYPLYGFELEEAGGTNPPVVTVEEVGRTVHADCDSFLEFVQRTLVVNTALRGDMFEIDAACGEETEPFLEAGFEEPYPVRHPWSEYPQDVLAAPGVLVITTEGVPEQCFAAARTEAGRQLLESLEVEWLGGSGGLWKRPQPKRRWS